MTLMREGVVNITQLRLRAEDRHRSAAHSSVSK
ncbi:hypothetical protein B7760_01238 [Burkholderia glumae]|nr:hypothetical protein KS03_2556 [Burkholderia glumae LMG 2196 = ATCC 33617]QKM47229.1 hypothetical protein B7760_01238 [Burkholderia glumae]QKM54643.1 hypothetical protein CG017_02680 [Burkholderia glumae]QTP33008.1 hypothetical protein B7759_01587 [Burkholderia glumae]